MAVALLGAGGTMGRGMARSLARAEIGVRAWNRTPSKLEGVAAERRVKVCRDPAEAAAGATCVLTMLSDAEATLSVMEGARGAASGAPDGAVWAQMGTIGNEGTRRCATLADRAGLVFVDAPVLGTKQPAEEGSLVVLASGPEAAREQLAPIFDAVGKRTLWVGEAGAGSRLEVAINSWIVAVVEGAAETIALAEGMGVDPKLVLEAISGGPLDLPYMRTKAEAMLRREFPPSFRLGLAAKDARLAAAAAEAAELDLPMIEAIAERMSEAAERHSDEDLAATYLASAAPAA
jgi:3-hydroxyisobutyrate dehydrogenase